MNKILLIFCIFLPIACATFFVSPYIGPFVQFEELYYLKDVVLEDPTKKAKQYFDNKQYANTQNFIEFYQELPCAEVTPEMNNLLESSKEKRASLKYITAQTLSGFFLGKSQEAYGEYARIASDLTSVGDIRDLISEGYKFATDKDVDVFIVALATISVSLNLLPTVTAHIKSGLSILRKAKRTKAISKRMQDEIISLSKKGVSLEKLVEVLIELKEFVKIHGLSSAIEVIRFSDSLYDIPKIIKIASKFGKNAGKFLKFGGKDVIEVASKQGTDVVRHAIGYGENAVSALKKSPRRILTKDVPRFRRLMNNFGGWLFDAIHLATNFVFMVITIVLSFIPLMLFIVFSIIRKQQNL